MKRNLIHYAEGFVMFFNLFATITALIILATATGPAEEVRSQVKAFLAPIVVTSGLFYVWIYFIRKDEA